MVVATNEGSVYENQVDLLLQQNDLSQPDSETNSKKLFGPDNHWGKRHGDPLDSYETSLRLNRSQYTSEEAAQRFKDKGNFDKQHQSESIEDRRNIIDKFFNTYEERNILGREAGLDEIGADSPMTQMSKDAGKQDIADIGSLHRDAKRAWMMFREEESAHKFNEMDSEFKEGVDSEEKVSVGSPER